MCFLVICICSLSVLQKVFCLFLKSVYLLSHTTVKFFCVLDIDALSDIQFDNIFSHPIGHLFILLTFFLSYACVYHLFKFLLPTLWRLNWIIIVGAEEMAQRLKLCSALTEDLSLASGIHIWQLTSTYNSKSMRYIIFFWFPMTLHSYAHTHIHAHIHANKHVHAHTQFKIKNKSLKTKQNHHEDNWHGAFP